MQFEFSTANRILFGPGVSSQLGTLAGALGGRALFVTGRQQGAAAPMLADLGAHGLEVLPFSIDREPTTHRVQQGVQLAREAGCDLVIACGGGSAIDAGKAIATLLTNPGEPLDYLEVVGRGLSLKNPPVPCIAVPTTAGTGAEVTRNAVLDSPEHQVKASLRSPQMLPRLALVDPELTYSLPPEVTASTGLDALTQVLEPFVSKRANPLTDALCREGLARAARSLRQAYRQGDDAAARQDMSLTSLFGGLALANAGLGVVHGFAGPIGGRFHAPHGAVCAALLPHVMEANVRALQARAPDHPALARYDEIARLLTGDAAATAAAGVDWIRALAKDLNIQPLTAFGLQLDHLPGLVEITAVASSTKANPIPLTNEELYQILEKTL